MKPLYILKIGGSIATYKNRQGISIRKSLLQKIAKSIKKVKDTHDFNLILIHGAGAAGHQLAKKYALDEGTKNDQNKMYGALLSRVANQKLNTLLMEIFIANGLPTTSINTASVIIQKNKHLSEVNTSLIKESLRQNCIPLLYGEMVFDKTLGMTICSGDVIAPYLAKEFKAQRLLFASDINGLYTKDPHLHAEAKLITEINIKDIKKQSALTGSHNVDMSGGLMGKIKNLSVMRCSPLQSVELFNGFNHANFENILLNKPFPHSTITLK